MLPLLPQMNTVTSFLDGSHIYGSDPSIAKRLRTLSGGKLKEETKKNCQRGFLPTVDVKSDVCDLRNSSEPCYFGGKGETSIIGMSCLNSCLRRVILLVIIVIRYLQILTLGTSG